MPVKLKYSRLSLEEDLFKDNLGSLAQIKIISHKDKHKWELIPKYHIGKK